MALDASTLIEGDYFVDANGNVWLVDETFADPTVIATRIDTKGERDLVDINDPRWNQATKLVPE